MQHPRLLPILLIFSYVTLSFSQEKEAVRYPNFTFDGVFKTKFEYVPSSDTCRFDVRNSRLGIKGQILPNFDYRAQVELSNEGKFQVLDLNGTIRPYQGLSFTFGQTTIPIFNPYTIAPNAMMFANRTFLGKYFAGSRDVGLASAYNFKAGNVPLGLEFGVFNGNTINNMEWRKKLSYAARLSVGGMKGFRSTVKIYDYPNSDKLHYFMYGADMRYEADRWKVETEAMQRDDKVNGKDLFAYYLQGAYSFPMKETYLFKNITPAARYDLIDQIKNDDKIDVSRITVGLGFGLGKKAFNSMLRIDYEWYLVNNQLGFLNQYAEMDANKLTIELLYIF